MFTQFTSEGISSNGFKEFSYSSDEEDIEVDDCYLDQLDDEYLD
jgi:hypothetical protein